jgi:hypothetical protein
MARRPMKTWEKYEEVTKQLLTDIRDFLGLTRIEGKQKVKGQKSGTEWQIDVVAYDATENKTPSGKFRAF